jgi:hypothetical protein
LAASVRFSLQRPPTAFLDADDTMSETDTALLHAQLCAAITRRSLILFEYGDLIRVVEPHRFGLNTAGRAMLSGWLRAGYSRSDPAGGWRNYLLDDIRSLQILDAPFAGTRPGFTARDQRMREVYAELTPSAMELPAEGPYVVRDADSPVARMADLADTRPAPGAPSPSPPPSDRDGQAEPPEATR